MYIYYAFLIIIAFWLFKTLKKQGKKIVLSEYFWVLFPWGICLSMHFFGGISYEYKVSYKNVFYIIAFLALIVIGIFLGKKISIKNNKYLKKDIDNKKYKKINLKPLSIISTISAIIYALYIIKTNEIVLGSTRTINRSMFATILVFVTTSSLIVWLYELSYSLTNDKKIPLYAYMSFITFDIPSIIISGRDGILIQVLSSFFVFIYCNYSENKNFIVVKNMLKKHKNKIIIAIICLFIYFSFLTSNRYGDEMIDRFEWATKAKISEELMNTVRIMGNVGYLFLNAIYYYSSQFVKLFFIMDHYEGPYLGGLYQLHFISRRLPESWGGNYLNAVNAADNLMKSYGYNGLIKMWGTVIEYYIYDFGKIGALMMSAITGILIGKSRKSYNKNKNEFSIITQAMVCTALFISVQISPIFDLSWIFPFIWLCILKLLPKKGVDS